MASSDDDEEMEDATETSCQELIRIPLGNPAVVFGLPGSECLLDEVLRHLGWRCGECTFNVFDNGEIGVKVSQSVTNHDVFVIAVRNDACSEVNFSLMRLLLLIDALRSESPFRLTVIVPCLEYARQDRKMVAGEGIPPKLMLRCMKTAGADRFITVDLHNQAEGAFSAPGTVLDELSSERYLADFIKHHVPNVNEESTFVCATNGGGMKFTRRMADILGVRFMMADKFRQKAGGKDEVKIICDSEVKDVSSVIVIDDMFDTCGSLAEVCSALHRFLPSAKLFAVAPHGYFSADALKKVKSLVETSSLEWLAVTDSVSQARALQRFDSEGLGDRLKVIEISRLLAGAIKRVHMGATVNLQKFRDLGPRECDPVLAEGASPQMGLRRRTTSS